MMTYNKICFLDRNAIGTIDLFLNYRKKNERILQQRMPRIKRIDRPYNIVSSLLSIMEGVKGLNETKDDKETAIISDSHILKFFKKAKTDVSTNMILKEKIKELQLGRHEENFFQCIAFYKSVHNLLINEMPISNARKKDIIIIDKARENGIDIHHPIVLLCLAAMYKNKFARNVLKIKPVCRDSDIYNAISDVLAITRLILISNMIYTHKMANFVDFITFDKALEKIWESFSSYTSILTKKQNDIIHTVELYNIRSLFRHLPERQYFEIIDKLKK